MTPDDKPLPMAMSLVSVSAEEERFLRSLLALLRSYLEPSWCVVARLGDFPDAVLVDMDNEEGRHVWENVDFGGTPRIALSRDRVLAAEWTLLKPIRPGGAHSLTEVLHAVAGKVRLFAPARSAVTSKWRPFVNLVREACDQSSPADIILKTGSTLVVDPAAQVFYSSRTTDELVALLRNRRRLDGRVVPVPDASEFAGRLARSGIGPRPLEQLCWLTGLITGAGESLGGWNTRELVRLCRWPNFLSLPHRQHHLKMAAILTDHATHVDTLAEACEVPTGDVADFLNACAEIGLLETQAAPVDDSQAATNAWRSALGRLRRKEA